MAHTENQALTSIRKCFFHALRTLCEHHACPKELLNVFIFQEISFANTDVWALMTMIPHFKKPVQSSQGVYIRSKLTKLI